MSFQAQLVAFASLPIILLLFQIFPTRKAILLSFVGGWLLLPLQAGMKLPLIPDFFKPTIMSYGVLLGILIFDFPRLINFKPKWIDIPILIWCVCPIFSYYTNGLRFYDGLNLAFSNVGNWGVPYLIGRLYLGNLSGLKALAETILKSGLLYIPLYLFEIRLSPQLHRIVYGYAAGSKFLNEVRVGSGFRPKVFQQHGLSLGLWMMAATIVAIWLWQSGTLKTVWNIPIILLIPPLVMTFLLGRSMASIAFFLYGVVILVAVKLIRNSLPLIMMIVGICAYLFVSFSGIMTLRHIEQVYSVTEQLVGTRRASSLTTRLEAEILLAHKTRQQLLFGWAEHSRTREQFMIRGHTKSYIVADDGSLIRVQANDTLSSITFGQRGLVGIIAIFGTYLIPVLVFCRRYPAYLWLNPTVAGAAVLCFVVTCYTLDSVLNAHLNPVYTLAVGGISGLVVSRQGTLQPASEGSIDKTNVESSYLIQQQRRRKLKEIRQNTVTKP